MSLPTAGTFDEVLFTTPTGEVNRLTREEFEKLPLKERVTAVLQKRLRFMRQGNEIPIREAIKHYG